MMRKHINERQQIVIIVRSLDEQTLRSTKTATDAIVSAKNVTERERL